MMYAYCHLLLNVIMVLSKSKKAFSTVAVLLRINLIRHFDLLWIVAEGRRSYLKCWKNRNKSTATT